MKKRRRIVGMKPLWMVGIMIMMISTIFTMAGCSKDSSDSISTSVTNPNPDTFESKGEVRGFVRDSVTLQPIVGAKASIGGQEGTTDEYGLFVIKDVPATTDALNGTVTSTYNVVVDLRKVTKPVDMTANPAPEVKYPEFTFSTVKVSFTSFNDSSPCPDDSTTTGTNNTGVTNCGTNSTNHDTPVNGLANNIDSPITVGKLDANIKGIVAGCGKDIMGTESDFYTPQAGLTVKLYSMAGTDTGSGAIGHLLGHTTTDSSGKFEFKNIEAGLSVKIAVFSSADQSQYGNDSGGPTNITSTWLASKEVTTPPDGQTLDLTDVQASWALHACSNDSHGPRIVEVTPEPGADFAVPTSGDFNVTFRFSEPVEQNSGTSTDPSAVGSLYSKVEVNYDGAKTIKGSKIKHSLEWNAAFDELTVKIPNIGVSSLYHVQIPDVKTLLADAEGNGVEMGVCPDASKAPATYAIVSNGGSNDCTVWFSTKLPNDAPLSAPAISLVNKNNINEANGRIGIFDWPQAQGAKKYKMYCRSVQKWGDKEQRHGYVEVSGLAGSGAQIDFAATPNGFCDDSLDDGDGICLENPAKEERDAFVENNEVQIVYDCYATGLSADNIEGPASNIERVEDILGPKLSQDPAGEAAGKLSCPSTGSATADGIPTGIGSICDDATKPDEITKIVLWYDEEVQEEGAETAANYVFNNLVTGTTAAVDPVAGQIYYDPRTRLVLLPLSDRLDSKKEVKGAGLPVIRTGSDGTIQTSPKALTDDYIPDYIGTNSGNRSGVLSICTTNTEPCASSEILAGACVYFGEETPTRLSDTTKEGDDVVVPGIGIVAGADGKCSSRANSADPNLGDDIQVVDIGGYSGVCGTEGATDVVVLGDDVDTTISGSGLILAGNNGVCDTSKADYDAAAGSSQIVPTNFGTPNSAGIVPGPNGKIDTTDINIADALEDPKAGTAIKVTNVKDIAGKTIRDTGDEFTAGGAVK